ncbi:Uncharacterised protein [uncultured archaeon]|nr:Uncharacterised protein [uncultured archaeon]
MEFETTFAATESRTFTVPFIGMPTFRALLRSVSGIHKEDMLSERFGLIADKLFKLAERPAIELAAKLFTSSLLDSDLAQIFKSKYGAFRVYDLLGYAVIDISHKPSFLAGHLPKLAFGRACAFGLQLFAKIGITSTPILDLLGVVKCVIRADRDIHHPAIYPKNIERSDFFRVAMLKRYVQVECFVSAIIRDCRRLDSPTKIISVMQWHKESGLDSSFGTGNCRHAVDQVHGNNSLVVSHCRERLSFWERFTFNGFQSFASAVSCTLHQRRRKVWDAFTSKLVGCVVVIDLIPGLVLESHFAEIKNASE